VIKYQQESLSTCKSDAIPLLEKHWEEIALNKDKIKLNPDWDAYANLEDMERCFAIITPLFVNHLDTSCMYHPVEI